MKRLVLAGYGEPLMLAFNCLKNEFNILGVIKDYNRIGKGEDEFDKILSINKISKLKMCDLNKLKPDLLFVINYNKIIDQEDIKNILSLNLHMGILPKYRGNNANAWAIMNGEREVGYTIHEISSILDGGDIFYTFRYKILENQTYFDAKEAIVNDINNNLSHIIKNILDGTLERVSQLGSDFVYCSRLKPSDGFISSWDISNEALFGKYIIFAKPAGTGLLFEFKGEVYEINKISNIENFANSRGIAGAVVMKKQNGSVWIKTADNAISLDELTHKDRIIRPSEIFKIGDRL
jgi:methionyl-tRNA formyltransferase